MNIRPNHARSRRALAMALLRHGDAPGAAEQIQAALALSPEDPDALKEMGAICLVLAQPGQALYHLERAGKINPEDEEIILLLGKARQALQGK